MVRGLFSPWKQVIYAEFNQKMTTKILFDLIERLHKNDFHVSAVVSDCGGSNQGLWSKLNISDDEPFFAHPCGNGKNIYVFADAPHLLKLTRNWLLDTGFLLEGNIKITQKPLERLLNIPKRYIREFNSLNISRKHLDCKGVQRQNVPLATELLSRTTALQLKRHLTDDSEAQALSDFIMDINNYFDIFNVYCIKNETHNKLDKPYGLYISEQDKVLNKVKSTMSNMLCIGKNTPQVFQRAMIISVSCHLNIEINLKIFN